MKFDILLVLVLTVVGVANGESLYTGECHKDDLKGLELLKGGITYDPNGLLKSWNGLHCCQWLTVDCDDNTGRVTVIDFYGFDPEPHEYKMNGTFSGDALALLPYLERLVLENLGGISGEIPPAIGQYLPNVYQLVLSGNMFTGPVPESIGMLSKLDHLSLFDNQFSGSLPSSLGTLVNLRTLLLDSNRFSGSIPESFSNMTNLLDLRLDYNSLSGKIPESIGDLTSLVHLNLTHNQLSGNIPDSIGSLTSVRYLYLNENNFSGRIPEVLLKMSNLSELNMSYNNFVGEIPQGQPLIGFPSSAFEGNKDLCGKPLKSCN